MREHLWRYPGPPLVDVWYFGSGWGTQEPSYRILFSVLNSRGRACVAPDPFLLPEPLEPGVRALLATQLEREYEGRSAGSADIAASVKAHLETLQSLHLLCEEAASASADRGY